MVVKLWKTGQPCSVCASTSTNVHTPFVKLRNSEESVTALQIANNMQCATFVATPDTGIGSDTKASVPDEPDGSRGEEHALRQTCMAEFMRYVKFCYV